jgi:hypothetical protein
VDVQLRESSSLTISEDSENGIELLLKEGFGRIRAVLMHWLKPRFEVRTPTAVLAVRGTEYSLDIRDGREVLSVYEGVVVATPALGGEPVPVKAGEQLSWGRSLPWPPPVRFDPAPGGGGVK